MPRPGDQIDMGALENALPGLSQKVHIIHAPLIEIASTDLRHRIAAGRPFRYYLHPAVYRLILERGYYH
jgi:nicotinate-nucleotide adenylyltransferase